jgi:hypothetical protein
MREAREEDPRMKKAKLNIQKALKGGRVATIIKYAADTGNSPETLTASKLDQILRQMLLPNERVEEIMEIINTTLCRHAQLFQERNTNDAIASYYAAVIEQELLYIAAQCQYQKVTDVVVMAGYKRIIEKLITIALDVKNMSGRRLPKRIVTSLKWIAKQDLPETHIYCDKSGEVIAGRVVSSCDLMWCGWCNDVEMYYAIANYHYNGYKGMDKITAITTLRNLVQP